MKKSKSIWALGLLTIAFLGASFASGQTPDKPDADALFQQGHFADAEKAYEAALATDPKNAHAQQRLGEIALFSNRFGEAETHLRKAIELGSDPKKAQSLLGQIFFRQDNFQEAAKWYRAAGNENKAAELEAYKGLTPYLIEGDKSSTKLKFVATDPLPSIQVNVNGKDPAEFLLDTGGPEVVIEQDYAKQLGLTPVGAATTGTFAGGQQAALSHSRASFTLGDFVVKDVPVLTRPLPQLNGTKIRGILGTEMLYHFLATLDYPGGQLILRRKSAESLKPFAEHSNAGGQVAIPFWMAGDHYMVAWGSVNQLPELLFVDTGLSAGGFLCPESTLKEAEIHVPAAEDAKATAAEETVKPIAATQPAPPANLPFVVDRLSLGDAHAEKIKGLTGVFPPSLENTFGFRIAGLISHQFFRPYAVTFDFTGMRIFLEKK